ncbi:MAG: crossover junction endodeoxyribonuclease RuvC [Firmicutes bacterium]|nr:crossover junction endodeoxyribonuclease RuvC [Dethiobacter sp.]MBS3887920.1 crossover junction endodeoxyribonuclease RuvC [Bacillota bacterium]MBS4054240.1 crossover junction endodeoxyribonuclease RuvC [Thermaerobacter sp.]
MLVLGIDPGLALTGFGVVEEINNKVQLQRVGCIRTPATLPAAERLQIIFNELAAVLVEGKINTAAVEQLFFNTNVTTALAVAQARGVILLALANQNIPTAEYTPLQVKQALTGFGRADKGQIQRMVQSMLGLKEIIRPDDAADAVAIALCHLQSYRFSQAIGKGGQR